MKSKEKLVPKSYKFAESVVRLIELGARKTRRCLTGYVEHSIIEQAKKDGVYEPYDPRQ